MPLRGRGRGDLPARRATRRVARRRRPGEGTALLYEEGRASEVRYAADGRTFAHGAVTHGPWIHARTAQLPFTRTVRPVTLAAVGNPAFAFTLARGAARPKASGDAFAVTYDRAVAEPGDLLERLLGEWPAQGTVTTRDGLLSEVRYALLGPVAFAPPSFEVTVRVLRIGLPAPVITVPVGALPDFA